MLKKILVITLLLCPISAFAYWQVAGVPINRPGTQAAKHLKAQPKSLTVNPRYTLFAHKGLLYSNVTQYAKQHGWRVRWSTKRHRYHLVRNISIAGPSFQAVLTSLFIHYPWLKVTYNKKHKIIMVSKRTKR